MQHLGTFSDPLAVGAMLGALAFLGLLLKFIWDDADLAAPSTHETAVAPAVASTAAAAPLPRHDPSCSTAGPTDVVVPVMPEPIVHLPVAAVEPPDGTWPTAPIDLVTGILPAAPAR